MHTPSQIRSQGRRLHAALDQVIEQRGWSTPKRRAHQWRMLRSLVQHAHAHVPLYQRLFAQAGFIPAMLDDWDDLSKIPFLAKADLRSAAREDLTAKDPRGDIRWLASSGSTGIPASMARTEESLWHYMACNTALYHDWCHGQPLSHGLYFVDMARDSIDFAAADLLRTTVPDSRIFSVHEPVDKLTRELLNAAPEFISSYPSTLRAIALELRAKGREMKKTRLIHLTSEMLDAHTRRLLAQIFPNARLIETYTSTEGGLVAWQCVQDSRWHVAEANVLCEIVDDEGRPTEGLGHMVITDLTNTATPILRYRGLGDLARWETEPCPCGSSARSIRQIEGRSAAMLRTRGGGLVSPYVITNAIEEVPGLAQYQVVQKQPGMLEVRVVAETGAARHDVEKGVRGALETALDHAADLQITFVSTIAAPPGSHKVPLVISELPPAA
ncbi:phenylacetate--CoA ligase family protein [Prosthecobacter sp.]|uniref:phenylacetate--CoA ligase family protein n=1 Tax=Prosthecobacter sp. TaxID=1965333 RepID=UPI003784E737